MFASTDLIECTDNFLVPEALDSSRRSTKLMCPLDILDKFTAHEESYPSGLFHGQNAWVQS